MNRNFDEILNEKFDLFKSEKNTLGGEDLKIVNDAIHYMKYIKSYSDAIKTGNKWIDPSKTNEDISEAAPSLPKPKDTDNLRKGVFGKDQKLKLIKLLNSAVIKYQDLYQKMYQLIGKYSQLQKIYGAYTNNNQMYANMFDCPTWEERKGLGKFASDEQILKNLLKFKENLEKVIKTTQSDEDADISTEKEFQKTVIELMKDDSISSVYKPEQLRTILKNLSSFKGMKFESVNAIHQLIENELDLTTKTDKRIQVLKKLLLSYAEKGEDHIQKLLQPENAGKIAQYIFSQSSTKKQEPQLTPTDLEQKAELIKGELAAVKPAAVAKKVTSFIDVLVKEISKPSEKTSSEESAEDKPAKADDEVLGKL